MSHTPGDSLKWLDREDAIKTYRYLRIGIIGAVVALLVSILIEWGKVQFSCLQTSISAYYYTPVRAVLVGSMIAVGFALIVYKGRSAQEDFCLNFAGMLAPVVAIAPTTDIGPCWSRQPHPRPRFGDDTLAPWLIENINNNFRTLLWTGLGGLALALILVIVVNWKNSRQLEEGLKAPIEKVGKGTWASLGLTFVLLAIGWWLIWTWDRFYDLAHGYSAGLFFVFLWFAIVFNVIEHRKAIKSLKAEASKEDEEEADRVRSLKQVTLSTRAYEAVALVMIAGIVIFPTLWQGSNHKLLWLEGWEIIAFAAYWIIQTAENWDEKVELTRVEIDAPSERTS